MPDSNPRATPVTWLYQHQRRVVVAGLAFVTLLCWAWIIPMGLDMYGAMSGPSAWMMTTEWDAAHLLLLWAMWAVMMAGMMLPSAAPLLLLYSRGDEASHGMGRVVRMAAGYLLVWAVFSVAATLLQRVLSQALLITPMMEAASPSVSAALLGLAGVYQLTPFKRVCLDRCRSPLAFVLQQPASRRSSGFRLGVAHGLDCLGCCWALMLLLFAGGVMNLTVIALLTTVVLVEKVAPFGQWSARLTGIGLLGAALWLII